MPLCHSSFLEEMKEVFGENILKELKDEIEKLQQYIEDNMKNMYYIKEKTKQQEAKLYWTRIKIENHRSHFTSRQIEVLKDAERNIGDLLDLHEVIEQMSNYVCSLCKERLVSLEQLKQEERGEEAVDTIDFFLLYEKMACLSDYYKTYEKKQKAFADEINKISSLEFKHSKLKKNKIRQMIKQLLQYLLK